MPKHLLLSISLCCFATLAGASPLDSMLLRESRTAVVPWKQMRDAGIVHQQLDFSCGAASLATLLRGYYRLDVTEKNVIDAAGKEAWLSFADMTQILPRYGLKGVGLALDYAQLKSLKIPVIALLETRAGPHFVVLRGMEESHIWVADPGSGNQRYLTHVFLEKWITESDPQRKGKVLAVLPEEGTALSPDVSYFAGQAPPGSLQPGFGPRRLPLELFPTVVNQRQVNR